MIALDSELHRMQTSERTEGRDLSDEDVEEEMYERGSDLMDTSYAASQHRSHTSSALLSSQSASVPKVYIKQLVSF